MAFSRDVSGSGATGGIGREVEHADFSSRYAPRLMQPVVRSGVLRRRENGPSIGLIHTDVELCPSCGGDKLVMNNGERFCDDCGLVTHIEGLNIRTVLPSPLKKVPKTAVEQPFENESVFGEGYRAADFINPEALPKE